MRFLTIHWSLGEVVCTFYSPDTVDLSWFLELNIIISTM
jgi:hypothetical protein